MSDPFSKLKEVVDGNEVRKKIRTARIVDLIVERKRLDRKDNYTMRMLARRDRLIGVESPAKKSKRVVARWI